MISWYEKWEQWCTDARARGYGATFLAIESTFHFPFYPIENSLCKVHFLQHFPKSVALKVPLSSDFTSPSSFRRFLPGRLLWPLHHRHITPQLETKQDSVNYMVKGPTDKLELWDWNHPLLRHIGKKLSERPIRHMGSLWQTISNIMVNPALNCSGSLNFSERQKYLIFRCPCRRTTKLCPQWLRRETSG